MFQRKSGLTACGVQTDQRPSSGPSLNVHTRGILLFSPPLQTFGFSHRTRFSSHFQETNI